MSELQLLPKDKPNYTVNVLKAAAAGTVVTASVVAPNLLQLLARVLNKDTPEKSLRAIRYARDKGWITFRETRKGIEVALTASGKLRWQTIELQQPLHMQRWDHKWRFVLFDIPTKYKYNADGFRQSLKRLGLQQVQQSVWVTPYVCQPQVAVLRQIYEVKPYVQIVEATAIEHENELRKRFKLN